MGDGDRTVLVGMDGSEYAVQAVRWAYQEAAARHARLHVLYVWHLPAIAYTAPTDVLPPDVDVRGDIESQLEEALAHFDLAHFDLAHFDRADLVVQFDVVEGYPARLLSEAAQHADVDLVVTGSRGRGGVVGLLLGSVSQELATHSPKPLVIVPAELNDWDQAGPVVVGVDGSPHSDRALSWAIAEAGIHHTHVRAVTAWTVRPISMPPRYAALSAPALAEQASDVLKDAVKRVGTQPSTESSVEVETSAYAGGPAPVLLEQSRNASMLVVGRRGLGGIRGRLMGSTSHALAHRSQIPMVIVPPDPTAPTDSPEDAG